MTHPIEYWLRELVEVGRLIARIRNDDMGYGVLGDRQRLAEQGLGALGAEAVPELLRIIRESPRTGAGAGSVLRRIAGDGLIHLGSEAEALLVAASRDPDERVRVFAQRALADAGKNRGG